jgi:hypothetical protein
MNLDDLTTITSGLVSKKIEEKRWKKCLDCTFLTKHLNRCRKCGCFMKIKVKLKKARCPIGIWQGEQ